jgi:hypothetical protein
VLVDDARDIAMLRKVLKRGVSGGDGGSMLAAVLAVPQELIDPPQP